MYMYTCRDGKTCKPHKPKWEFDYVPTFHTVVPCQSSCNYLYCSIYYYKQTKHSHVGTHNCMRHHPPLCVVGQQLTSFAVNGLLKNTVIDQRPQQSGSWSWSLARVNMATLAITVRVPLWVQFLGWNEWHCPSHITNWNWKGLKKIYYVPLFWWEERERHAGEWPSQQKNNYLVFSYYWTGNHTNLSGIREAIPMAIRSNCDCMRQSQM